MLRVFRFCEHLPGFLPYHGARTTREEVGIVPKYSLGIDPGDRYIGLALVRIEDDDQAYPLYLDVIDLGQGQNSLRSLVAGRSIHRRARRTRKSARARIRKVQDIVEREHLPEDQAAKVIALCRRRGGQSDQDNETDDKPDEYSLRQPRDSVLATLRELIPIAAPQLSEQGVHEIIEVLDAPCNAHGLDNKRVGSCVMEGCKKKRCVGVDYPALWLLQGILTELMPPKRRATRECFLQRLRTEGLDIRMGLAAFKCKGSPQRRTKHWEAVRKTWRAIAKSEDIPDAVRESVDRLLQSASKQLREASSPTRFRMCPDHLYERVLLLSQGENPPAGVGEETTHSLVWEAVAAKLSSYLAYQLTRYMPAHAVIDRVVVERAAFDLLHLRSPSTKVSSTELNQARWLGPYGQLKKLLAKEQPSTRSSTRNLLAFELGGICALCGKTINGEIDRAHLAPQELVGGYPYVGIVAAHPVCNTLMGKSRAHVHPAAVEAMRETRNRLMRNSRFVHAWFDAKLGIMNALAFHADEALPVDRFLMRAFASRESTMQGADRIGDAVAEAIKAAGFGDPTIEKRGATEVAGARWAAMKNESPDAEPWFSKDADKQGKGILNHALDAFVVASLPPAEPLVGKGERRWAVSPEGLSTRLAVLQSEDAWQQASAAAWSEYATYGSTEPKAVDIQTTTMRRVWRQAYPRDTRIRHYYQDRGRGAYRISAEEWLSVLASKNSEKKALAHIENLQFAPLRETLIDAFKNEQGDKTARCRAARKAMVNYLKHSTLQGLASSQAAHTQGHPVREKRIMCLRSWAERSDWQEKVPPWIGVTLEKDRAFVAKSRLPIKQGGLNLESWGMHMWLLAIHQEGWATVFSVGPEGGLSYRAGKKHCEIDSSSLQAIILVAGVTPLAPSVLAWRRRAGEILCSAGFNKAWVVGCGSVIETADGKRLLIVSNEKSFDTVAQRRAYETATTVVRGGIVLMMRQPSA